MSLQLIQPLTFHQNYKHFSIKFDTSCKLSAPLLEPALAAPLPPAAVWLQLSLGGSAIWTITRTSRVSRFGNNASVSTCYVVGAEGEGQQRGAQAASSAEETEGVG